jgi:hypothetical protein
VTARAIGVRGDGALLARPDGVPVGLWSSSAGAPEKLLDTELHRTRLDLVPGSDGRARLGA